MALTDNGIVTISGSPSGGNQPMQNAGATMVAGVIVPTAGFLGIGSGAAQVDAEVFGVQGSARVSNVLAIAGSPVGAEKLFVGGSAYLSGASDTDLNLRSNSDTGRNRIFFGDLTSPSIGILAYSHTDNSMSFYTAGAERMKIESDGGMVMNNLPTSDPLVAGELWNNSGVVNISAG